MYHLVITTHSVYGVAANVALNFTVAMTAIATFVFGLMPGSDAGVGDAGLVAISI
jgi:hypothetical protein